MDNPASGSVNPVTSDIPAATSSAPPVITTTNAPPTTNVPVTSDVPITSTDNPNPTPTESNNTPTSAIATTPSMVTSLAPVVTSSAVPVVSVSTSGDTVMTYTFTSYSTYETTAPTVVPHRPTTEKKSSIGAIVGGVVGGVAGVILIGIIFCLMKRRNKNKKNQYAGDDDDLRRNSSNQAHAYNEYNTYGTPSTMIDNTSAGSVQTGGISGAKPRPFVQAYNPDPVSQPQQYVGYDGSLPPQPPPLGNYQLQQQQQQQNYYQDYSQDGYSQSGYSQTSYPQQQQQYGYPHDAYYAQQPHVDSTIPMSNSSVTGNSSSGRYVPNEFDNNSTRHVPDEIDSTPPTIQRPA